MVDSISLVIIVEPEKGAPETLWAIPGVVDPERDDVPVAYEHPEAVKLFGPADQVIVQSLSDALAHLLKKMGLIVTQSAMVGD